MALKRATPAARRAPRWMRRSVLLAAMVAALPIQTRAESLILINWRNLSVFDAARLTSQATGRKIQVPPEIKVTISMASADPISSDEVFTLFQAALHERGLVVAPAGQGSFTVRPEAQVSPTVASVPANPTQTAAPATPAVPDVSPGGASSPPVVTGSPAVTSQPAAEPGSAAPQAKPTVSAVPASPEAPATASVTTETAPAVNASSGRSAAASTLASVAPTPPAATSIALQPPAPAPAPAAAQAPASAIVPAPAAIVASPPPAPGPDPAASRTPSPESRPAPGAAPSPAPVAVTAPPVAAPPVAATPDARPLVASATPGPSAAGIRMREETLAIFPNVQRAQSIADRLTRTGANASVVPGSDPSDPSFAVTLRFADTPEGYRSATQAIESANLSGVVSLPPPR